MKSVLSTIQKVKIGIPSDVIAIFENIVRNNELLGKAKTRDVPQAVESPA